MALIIYCSVASTINLLTNLRFLPDKIVLDLKELLPFTANDTEAKKKLVGFAFSWPHPHLYLCVEPLWSW